MSEREHYVEVLKNAVEGLDIESFIDVMTTASSINLSYKKLCPNATDKETNEQMWENIKAITSKQ